MSVVRVLIADDQARARATVRAALDTDPAFEVCAEASDADGAIEAAVLTRPDVCVLDINMPGSGISAAGRISSLLPDTAIVMLTVSRLDADLFDALRAGASGYVLKDIFEDRLGAALQQVLRGEASLPGTLVTRLVEEFRDREARRVPLSDHSRARLTGVGCPRADAARADDQCDGGPAVRVPDHGAHARLGGLAQTAGRGPRVRCRPHE